MKEKKDVRPKCYRCKWLCLADYGYSDYTVEGTDISCLQHGFENREQYFDDKDNEGFFAIASKTCGSYSRGEPLSLNVDCDQQEAINNRLEE